MRVARLAPVIAVLYTGHAHAAMLASLFALTAGSGGNFRYTYEVSVPDNERLDPSATSGVSCRGTSTTAAQCDPAGTFFTIYDIVGFVGVETPLPLGWSFSTQSTGITPSRFWVFCAVAWPELLSPSTFDRTVNPTSVNEPLITGPVYVNVTFVPEPSNDPSTSPAS